MNAGIEDVDRTLEYGHPHAQLPKVVPVLLVGIAIGLFMMTPWQTEAPRPREMAVGVTMLAICLALFGGLVYRRSQPDIPAIVLSPHGILFRDISDRIIPWNEIRGVGIDKVSEGRSLISTRVVSLELSSAFHSTYTDDRWLSSTVSWSGQPSYVYIGYFHALPLDEVHRAVLLRWHAFSRHAKDLPVPSVLQAPAKTARTASPKPEPAAVRPARSPTIDPGPRFAATAMLVSLFKEAPIAARVTNMVALLGIVAIFANHLGLWSTTGQDKARARAEEVRNWRQRIDAEDRQRREEQRQFDERMKKAFSCLEQGYFRGKDCN